MSHLKPEYSRFITSITVTNPGSGYNSASPPAIVISGGGGSGAIATATVVNGVINSINVTDGGTGYTSTPTITVASPVSGTTATAVAVMSWAQLPPVEYNKKSSLGVKYDLPEFIQEDHPLFVTFLQKYFEFLDQPGNPANILLNKHYSDIQDFDDAELRKKADELARDFPQLLQIDKKTLYKNIKDIYESKGSERSIKAFFKILYNEEIQLFYPSENILVASGGVWKQDNVLKTTAGLNDYDPTQLAGLIDIVYYTTPNNFTDEDGNLRPNNVKNIIKASINKVVPVEYTVPQAYTVNINIPSTVKSIPGPGAEATASATLVGGVITEVTIVNGGVGYLASPSVVVTDSTGTGADIEVSVENGAVSGYTINNGGSGYTNPTITFNNDGIRTYITERDGVDPRAYAIRTIKSVAVVSTTSTPAGFRTGDVFNYSSGAGDIAYFKVTSVNSSGVPTEFSVISPGSGFTTRSISHSIISRTGVTANITLTTDYLFAYPGKYANNKGKLSNLAVLQDNFKFQKYSYIIKSSLPQYVWDEPFRRHIHPAGKEVFGDLVLRNEINVGQNIAIENIGMHIFEFITEDLLYATEFVAKLIEKPVTDESNVVDFITISIEPFFSDNTEEVRDYEWQDYVDIDDYVLGAYVGYGGIIFNVGKNISETAVTTDVLERVVSFNPVLTDTVAVTESIIPALSMPRSHTDSVTVIESFIAGLGFPRDFTEIQTASDNSFIGIELRPSDSTTNTETFGINIQKNLQDPIGFSSIPKARETVAIDTTWSRSVSESISAEDTGVLTLLNYIDLTYFAEDYVGEITNIT